MKKAYPFLIFLGIVLLLFFAFEFILSSEIIEEIPISIVESTKPVDSSWNNKLPTFDNLTLSIEKHTTKFWNSHNQSVYEKVMSNVFANNSDLVVKVTVTNPIDIDWSILNYKWYYYYKDDPSRLLWVTITPGEINYVYFNLRWPWEYSFWVKIYDNDGGETVSEDVLWNWPEVFLLESLTNLDIPIVTLKADKTVVNVWETVTFDVFAKILSDRADFLQEREFKYDFDGDWERDLITKDDHVNYTYEKSNDNWLIPRVGVVYRWNMWTAYWWAIIVKGVSNLEESMSNTNYVAELTNKQQEIYDKISKLLKNIENENLVKLLLNLQNWLTSEKEIEANIIALQSYFSNENNINLNSNQKDEILVILKDLGYDTMISIIWWTEYDVAKHLWGNGWHMPTYNQFQELMKNCSWTRTTQNNIKGYLVQGNNNSIFLPCGGFKNGSGDNYIGTMAYYWSSTSNGSTAYCVWDGPKWYCNYRRDGMPIRPVRNQ